MNPYDFPPDIFWISPDGHVIEVIGHLTALKAHPELFGFSRPPETKKDADDYFRTLFEAGWVRGRFSDATFHFQMERPRGLSLGGAYDLVVRYADQTDRVVIDFTSPKYRGEDFTRDEFLAQKFPGAWGINPPKRRLK